MDGILESLGPWAMILLAGAVLGGVAVLVPMAVIFSLRMVESGVTRSHHVLQVGLRWLASQLVARRPSLQLQVRLSSEEDET